MPRMRMDPMPDHGSRPARPRLLACDIDGTLLDSSGSLHPSVRHAVRVVASSGVRVVLATERSPWAGVTRLCADLGLAGPQITAQGAVIADGVTGRPLRQVRLPAPLLDDVLRFASELHLEPVVGTAEALFAREPAQASGFTAADAARGRLLVVDDLAEMRACGAVRVHLPTGPRRHRHIVAAAAARFGHRVSLAWSDENGLDVLASGADKGSAVAWLADRLWIPRAAVAAVGDAPSDLSLLRFAARSAAMAGAPVVVRASATVVGGSNDADGLVEVLEAFFPDLAIQIRRPAAMQARPSRHAGGLVDAQEVSSGSPSRMLRRAAAAVTAR